MERNLLFIAALSISCSMLSCDKDQEFPMSDQVAEYGSYSFTISGSPCPADTFVGDNVKNTDWDIQSQLIYLENDPDYDSKQIMTMYIYYTFDESSNTFHLQNSNLLTKLATNCIAVGPGHLAKSRLYRPQVGLTNYPLDIFTIGSNFIAGQINNWKYDRVIIYPDDEPETVTINGTFVAKVR